MKTKIKKFEDACTALKLDPGTVLPNVESFPEHHRKGLLANAKLIIIAEALNDGWKPDWNNSDQRKYYPWFDMRTKSSGVGFAFIDFADDYVLSGVGSRLCFKSAEVAEYAGTQFLDVYRDYFIIDKK